MTTNTRRDSWLIQFNNNENVAPVTTQTEVSSGKSDPEKSRLQTALKEV